MAGEESTGSQEGEFDYSLLGGEESYVPEEMLHDDVDYEDLSKALAQQLEEVNEYLDISSTDFSPFHSPSSSSLTTGMMLASRPSSEAQSSPASPSDALQPLLWANRRYQQVLRNQLVLLEDNQRKMRELERWLKVMLLRLKQKRKMVDCSLPAPLVDAAGRQPPETELARECRTIMSEYHKVLRHAPRWSEREKMQLAKGVRQMNQNLLMDRILSGDLRLPSPSPPPSEASQDYFFGTPPLDEALEPSHAWLADTARQPQIRFGGASGALLTLLDEAATVAEGGGGSAGQMDSNGAVASKPEKYQQAAKAVLRLPPRELEMNPEGLDWAKISALFVVSRSAEECKTQWMCNQHPLINGGSFSESERKRLLALVKKHGENGTWVSIAEELGPDRTAWQCLVQYRQCTGGRTRTSGKWTAEEDRLLQEGVALYGDQDAWAEISESLEGRTGAQCIHRWFKTLDPEKRTGRWTPQEDAWLLAAVKRQRQPGRTAEESINWAVVQAFVRQRTDVQCRERYMNVLNPRLLHGEFTPEEDRRLRQAVQEHGEGKWAMVASLVPHRTDNQCRRRWMLLKALDNKRTRSTRRGKRPTRTRGRSRRKTLP